MSKLIAMVATAVMLDGKRTIIQPGEALPDLGKHDNEALVASGAAEDSAATAAADKEAAKAEAEAAAEIEAARERVRAEKASTDTEPAKTSKATKAAK
jgi:hypothetical protein